jgi:hypothetical protein
MTDQKKSVASWTAGGGGWGGAGSGVDRLGYHVQEITQCYQIRDGSYNAGSYYEFGIYCSGEQRASFGAEMRESQNREWSGEANIKHSFAQGFWNVVGVYYFRLLRFIGHWLRSF